MIRIMHLIVGLGTGGAETNLYRLVRGMDPLRFEHAVVSMIQPGPVRALLEECGVPVFSLNVRQGIPDPGAILRFTRLLRQWKPDLLQTWMYHADLLGTVSSTLLSGPPIIWNIRGSDRGNSTSRLSGFLAKVLARLSRLPAAIVSCSNAGRDFHAKLGYPEARMTVIFNGYDIAHFRPNPEASVVFRKDLGLPADAPIVTNVARYHPVKDHAAFWAAARVVRDANDKAFFVLCGDNVTWENTDLVAQIDRLGLRDATFLLGRRTDLNIVLASSAVLACTSASEGFPNVVAEAMACGAICVTTDVGDARHIVGDTGFVVPPGRPDEIAGAVLQALHAAANPGTLPSGRERIAANFSLETMVAGYESLYEQTLNSSGDTYRASVGSGEGHSSQRI